MNPNLPARFQRFTSYHVKICFLFYSLLWLNTTALPAVCPPVFLEACEDTYVLQIGNDNAYESAAEIVETSDGHFLIGGAYQTGSMLQLVSPDGVLLWTRTFDFTAGDDFIESMIIDEQGHVVAVGRDQPNAPTENFIFRYDYENDQMKWVRKFDDPAYTRFEGLLQKPGNGNYLVFGTTQLNGGLDNILLEVGQSDGIEIWEWIYNQAGNTDIFSEGLIVGDALYLSGTQRFGTGLDKIRAAVSKLDLNGNLEWTRSYFNSPLESARTYAGDMLLDQDSLVIIGTGNLSGEETSDNTVQLFKTALDGTIGWAKDYSLPGVVLSVEHLINQPDGYLLQGNMILNGLGKMFLIRVDRQGEILWAKSVGGAGADTKGAILLKDDYIYFSTTSDANDGLGDVIYGKMYSDGTFEQADCAYVSALTVTRSVIDNPYDEQDNLTRGTFFSPMEGLTPSATLNFVLPAVPILNCACQNPSCTNLLANGDFENGLSDWATTGAVQLTNDAYSGSGAASLCTTGSASISQIYPAVEGMDYSASIWAKMDNASNGAFVVLRFLGSNYAPLPNGADQQAINGSQYQLYNMQSVAPAGAAFVHLLVWKEGYACVETDDWELCEGSSPSKPDLTVNNLSVSPNPVEPGTALNIDFIISNIGTADLQGIYDTKIYISETPSIDQNSFLLVASSGQNVPLGFNLNSTYFPVLPANFVPGSYYLIVYLDFEEVFDEINEGNNSSAVLFDVVAPSNCTGNFVFNSQAAIDAFPGCPSIDGDLIIQGADIIDLTPLQTISYISQSLVILDNPNLESLNGLNQLGFAEIILIQNNPQLESLTPLSNLNNNDAVSVTIENNDQLSSLAGLEGISNVERLWVLGNANLLNINGLQNLSNVADQLLFSANPLLTNVDALNSLKSVGTDLLITSNNGLASLAGLSMLENIGRDLVIANADQLIGLSGLEALTSVGRSLVVQENNVLEQINSLANVGSTESLTIKDNPQLAVCCGVNALIESGAVAGLINIENNLTGCNSGSEILAACTTTGGDQIDLSLTISGPDIATIYSSYPVTLTLSNNGDVTANDIEVVVPKPAGVVYTGGNEYDASIGTFDPFGADVWTLNSLNAGASATLTINYFLLETAVPASYAQVWSVNETDEDSTPGNGTPPAVNEDDEASTNDVVMDPVDWILSNLLLQQSVIAIGEQITYTYEMDNLNAGNPGGMINIQAWFSTDPVLSPDDLQGGSNSINLAAISGLPFMTNGVSSTSAVGLGPGDYYLILDVDSFNDFDETNENNNQVVQPFSIAPDPCIGNVYLSSQAAVDAFPNCSIIDGILIIEGDDIVDLTPLSSLEEVTVKLDIRACYNLSSLEGLNNLSKVPVIVLDQNFTMSDLSALSGVGSNLINLNIKDNDLLVDLNGLEGVTQLEYLFIENNNALENFNGLGQLANVSESAKVAGNGLLENFEGLSSLETIGGDFQISNNLTLNSLTGLETLTSVGGRFQLSALGNIVDLNGLGNLIYADKFWIAFCDKLQTLDGINSAFQTNDVLIHTNEVLSDCCLLYGLLSNNLIASVDLYDNAFGCLNFLQIEQACIGTACNVSRILSTQAEVDNFNCSVVGGNLTIGGDDIVDLSPLTQLTSVTGILFINHNLNLGTLNGLNNLTSVGGLYVVNNPLLGSLDGLENLTGDELEPFIIESNDALIDLQGLEGITGVNYHRIEGNDLLQTTKGLDNLRITRADLQFIKNPALQNLNGLEQLDTINAYLVLDDNDALTDISALSGLESVGTIAIIGNDAIATLSGLENTMIESSISISYNNMLEQVDAFSSITSLDFLTMTNNPLLSDCCGLFPILSSGNPPGNIIINNNLPACDSRTAILTDCGSVGVDLSLEMTTSNPDPTIYTSSAIDLTIVNDGTEQATGIVIHFPKPAGVVYTGGNEWDATQGTFNPFNGETWTVGNLAAGATATLTVNYFLLTADPIVPFAQVQSVNESDIDSTPDNGTCCTPSEDDEASLILNQFNQEEQFLIFSTERQRLAIDEIYPNPSKYWVTLKMYTQFEQEVTLDFYDVTGRSIYQKKVMLKSGQNEIPVQIDQWRSGTYQIIGRGTGHPAYGRFVKVWE